MKGEDQSVDAYNPGCCSCFFSFIIEFDFRQLRK
jgi:hypothetical protein